MNFLKIYELSEVSDVNNMKWNTCKQNLRNYYYYLEPR